MPQVLDSSGHMLPVSRAASTPCLVLAEIKAVQGKGILASGSSCGFQVGVEQQVKGLFAFGQKVIVTGAAPACALQ